MVQEAFAPVAPQHQSQENKGIAMVVLDLSTITAWVCLIGSFLTLVEGLIYLIAKIADLELHWEHCDFFKTDCNRGWRTVFTFNPLVLLDLWTPIILGCIGMAIHMKPSLKFTRVTNYMVYAAFMLVTTLFGNFGYVGKFGILVGIVPLIGCLMCIVTSLLGTKSLKQLELGPSS
uniref:Transmembrane protein n=1 Tax=Alexandrium monilatum TaxID=311494 RepID=A0A7S4Q1V2_9DINO|mmetsp:Transcript_100475/g.299779  ORF Transcript_100475/g.299779 Transcript_100475/m.299779 type:complete len:175 (+) Transcript_100475:87-611(+)